MQCTFLSGKPQSHFHEVLESMAWQLDLVRLSQVSAKRCFCLLQKPAAAYVPWHGMPSTSATNARGRHWQDMGPPTLSSVRPFRLTRLWKLSTTGHLGDIAVSTIFADVSLVMMLTASYNGQLAAE